MIYKTTFLSFFLICVAVSNAQNLSSKVVDSISKKPIPYATVQLKNKGVITNEEGVFNFILTKNIKETDSLFVSCIGYESVKKPLKEFTNNVILLKPKAIELGDVIVTNKEYTAAEIIELVREHMGTNYNRNLSKKRLFFRESQHQNFVKSNVKFIKSSIEAFNKKFLDSVLKSVPKKSSYYSEILCDFYRNDLKNKQKIDLIKASKLYDKNKELGFTKLEEKFNNIIKENVKPNSYLKVKSGIFGTKIKGENFDEFYGKEIDSTDTEALKKELQKKKKQEKEQKTNYAKYKKRILASTMQRLFYMEDSKLNFINKPKKYHYTLQDFTFIGNDAVYIVDFESKGAADYKGRLYINSDDFAVIRVDYENIKPIRKFSLLGIFMNEFLDKGKIFFSKGLKNQYTVSFIEREFGVTAGVKRPLKIIEKNKIVKGKNRQNELSVKLDMAIKNVNKYEVVIFNSKEISNLEYTEFKEKNTISPTYMANYDSEFWKGYTIIEPNQAIKEFTSEE